MSDVPLRGLPALRVAEREARVWRRFWHTSVLTGVLVPLLFVGAMGGGLGGLIDESRGTVDGVSYLVFVTPGILAATALQSATGSSLWPIMGGLKWTRTFHAAAATPVSPGEVYLGYLFWTGARLALNAVLFVLVAAALGAVPSPWGVLAVPGAVLGGLAFAAPLCAYSAAQDTDLSFAVIFRLVVVPMFLFSGSFFPVSQLPDWLEPVAYVVPLWHGVDLCRDLALGTVSFWPSMAHVAYLLLWVAGGYAVALRNFSRRLVT